MIHQEHHDNILVARLEHGKVNALDADFLTQELLPFVQQLQLTPPSALVLTGTGHNFCAGADIYKMLEGRAYVERFIPLLTQLLRALLACPCPIVAAINGHAIAAGYFMAATCDYRIMVDGRGKVGLPEKRAGLRFPAIMCELIQWRIAEEHQAAVVEQGQLFSAQESLERHFIDQLVAPDALLRSAVAKAKAYAAIPAATFAANKQGEHQPLFDRLAHYTPSHDDDVIAHIASDTTQQQMHAFMQRATKQ